ncbi:MAG: hypothetical protein KIT09_02270 [Bryobacteraceae bacterium]|nr:hypothetical protein [Bryobacteraceae bacterium]
MNRRHTLRPATLFLLLLAAPSFAQPLRVYSRLLDPREHPDDSRRHVRPPSWETLGNRTQFTALRGFAVEDGKLVRFREELDKYTRLHDLGDVVWPSYPVLFADNLGELADEIRARKLFLFDIWGSVPGSGPGGYWQQFEPPAGVFELLESKLGDRWLGMDVGEQDGRYIGGYASQMHPAAAPRFDQYLNFHRHFERFTSDLGNRMSTLVSLNFGHYFLREGLYALIGAETAQALPNGQVYYCFIRGAGKQYGVPWFGNASVWNRWGYKTYGETGDDHGPTKGTSLSLLKRLVYSHVLYNSMLAGFESSWFDRDALSPVGRMQQAAHRWVKQTGQPGVMLTPIAIMADFFSGWSFPRHLYSPNVYRVWGNLPYGSGDYLTDGVLDLLYPGYQDSSYFHDETGFLTPTPYGDAADALLSDAPAWLLARYNVLVAAGELSGGRELRDKLEQYARQGGHLVLTAGNLAKWPDGLAGILVDGAARRIPAGAQIRFGSSIVAEDQPFDALPLRLPASQETLAALDNAALAAVVPLGKGSVTVLASPFGIPPEPLVSPVRNEIDRPLAKPFPLLSHVRRVLDDIFRRQTLFEAGDGLSVIVCRKGSGEYTVGVANNAWRERPLKIVSRIGAIESLRELPLDRSEWNAPGHLPESVSNAALGANAASAIAGGDIRIFEVRVRETGVEEIPHAAPPARPAGRALPLRNPRSIQAEILMRPTFFQHFDSAVVDWRYLRERSEAALGREAEWIKLQGLRLIVDLTSGLNLYPDLRLIDNIESDYARSMAAIEDVLAKMQLLGARDLIVSLHRFPENNFTREQTWAAFEKTLRRVCERAGAAGIAVHLRIAPGKPPANLTEAAAFVNRVAAENLRIAPSTSLLLASDPKDLAALPRDKIGLWLLAAPQRDIGGAIWNHHGPIAAAEDRLAPMLASAPGAPMALDAVYASLDEEYLDAVALAAMKR